MSEPENITKFQQMIGRILGALYAEHPRDQQFDISLVTHDETADECEEELFENTVRYLIENGYLTTTDPGFIRLNERAYHLLGTPNPLTPEKSLGSSLANWAKDSVSETGKSLFTLGANAALKALFIAITAS